MSENEFQENVLSALASIHTNIKWIIKIGAAVCLLAGMAAGTLWLRTEANMVDIANAATKIEQHLSHDARSK